MMKTHHIRTFLLLALAAAAFVSCSKEAATEPGGQQVAFTVIPQISSVYENLPTTYAAGTITSADGGIANVNKEKYKLRYILEVWSIDDSKMEYRKEAVTEVDVAQAPTFNLRLVAGSYKIAVWADFIEALSVNVANPVGVNLYYNADELTNVELIKTDFSDDAKDAYSASALLDLTTVGKQITLTLTRPLAKVRLVATDADQAAATNAGSSGSTSMADVTSGLNGSTATITFLPRRLKRYNVLTGEVTEALNDNANSRPVYNDYGTAYGEPTENHSQTLAWDYVFVPTGDATTNITIKMKNASNDDLVFPSDTDEYAIYKIIRNVTLKPNTLTTVVGNYFTKSVAPAPVEP